MRRLAVLITLLKCSLIYCQINQANNEKISRCQVFNKYGIKTFENDFYHFQSACGYTLTEFINNDGDPVRIKLVGGVVYIAAGDKTYELKKNANTGGIFVGELKTYTLPARENDIEVSKPGTYIVAKFSTLGLTVRWDTADSVTVEVDTGKNSALSGICSSAEKTNVDNWSEPGGCTSQKAPICPATLKGRSLSHCRQFISDQKYRKCLKVIPSGMVVNFLDVCVESHCNCKATNKNDCLCGLVEAFSRTCSIVTNQPVEWRKTDFCPKKCPSGQEYRDCGPRQKACGEPDDLKDDAKCIEGCICKLNLYLYNKQCIPVTKCPCYYDGNFYPPDKSITQDCKTCTCDHNNKWICPKGDCMVDADVVGDPHYTTFDKQRFDFMGKCTYYLVKGIDFTIKADHYVWQHNKYVKSFNDGGPSYVKVMYVEYDNHVIALKPGPVVTVDEAAINQFPYVFSGITINKPTTSKVIVELPNLVELHWDGVYTAKIRVPTTMRGLLAGLLGNFNKKPGDDFMMPDGSLANNANEFGHSWVVEGSCEDANVDPVPHPCHANPTQKPLAEKACAPLKTNLFTNCKEYNAETSYEACVYDCCLVAADEGEKCACANLADHADKCSLQQWRKTVSVCEVPCPKGQVYNYCINPCESSCEYLNLNKDCNKRCIEGCGCPVGQIFNEENECVPIEKCKCKLNQKYFPAGFKYLKAGNLLQTCNKGKWDSSQIKPEDAGQYVSIPDLQSKCTKKKHSNYTACKNPNPVTCKNMHDYRKKVILDCAEGCECQEGFVLNEVADVCVKPESCPCFYDAQSYNNNAIRKSINEICICKDNDWECTPYENPIVKCSIFGDTHIRNMDGKLVSFKSSCEYVLATAVLENQSFTITTKNGDVTIEYTDKNKKSNKVALKRNGGNFEKIGSTSDFKTSKVAELETLGLKLVWNQEGAFHIYFNKQWQNKVDGFCAHLEDPNKPLTNDDIRLFTNNWSTDAACFDTTFYDPTNEIFTSDNNPVSTKCDLLRSEMFKPCNEQLSIKDFYRKCQIIAMDFLQQEDENGAEGFYCQMFSSVAQECNDVGLPVVWRSKEQCPYECTDKGTIYNECISTCTCDTINNSDNKVCKDNSCIEGCVATSCRKGTLYVNDTFTECVTVDECAQIKCLAELEDHGGNCVCVKGKVICTTTTTSTSTATPVTNSPSLPKAESQKKLLSAFKNINQLLLQIKQPAVFKALAVKDKQIVDTFAEHMKKFKGEILCYISLSDRSKCLCMNNGQEVCNPSDTKNRLPENDIKLKNKLDILALIKEHLMCLLNVQKGCACISGQQLCKEIKPISGQLVYVAIINAEKHITKYFYYLQKAKSEINCLLQLNKILDNSCTCIDDQMICSPGQENEEEENNDARTKILDRYSGDVEKHLQCYARLKLDAGKCRCEGMTKICQESHIPIPADNKFEIVEQYLPSVVNIQQIEVGFTDDIECVKTLTDDKCSCVDGKQVCENMNVIDTQSSSTPTPNLDLEHLSLTQTELLNSFNNVEEQLNTFLETELTADITPKELQTVNIYKEYLSDNGDDIHCLLALSEFSVCKCIDGQEICASEPTEKYLSHNNIHMNNYLVLIGHIESQLICMLRKTLEYPSCVCLNSQLVCPDTTDTSAGNEVVYEHAVDKDKSLILLYSFLNYAQRDLKCLSKDPKSKTTTCSKGERFVVHELNPSDVIASNANKIKTYIAYIETMYEEILCYSRLPQNACTCRKGKQVCPDNVTVTPQNNDFSVVEKYVKYPINQTQIYDIFVSDILCLESLADEVECVCQNGKRICPNGKAPEAEGSYNKTISVAQNVATQIACLINRSKCGNEQYVKLPARDKLQLKVYNPYITFIETQLKCTMDKPGQQKCADISIEMDRSQPELYLELLRHIDKQLSCLVSALHKSSTCFCANGQKICENAKRPYILYPVFDTKVLTERNNERLYAYIKQQLKCFESIKDSSIPCSCKNGKKTCETPNIEETNSSVTSNQGFEIDQDISRIVQMDAKLQCFERTANFECFKDATTKTIKSEKLPVKDTDQINVLNNFLDYTKKQLECLKPIGKLCDCKGFKYFCRDDTPYRFDPATLTGQNFRDPQIKLYKSYIDHVNSQLECLSTINTQSRQCACIAGRKICKETRFPNLFFPIADVANFNAYDHTYMENHIKCTESVKGKNAMCTCSKGNATCDEIPPNGTGDEHHCSDTLKLSSTTLPYKKLLDIVTSGDVKLLQTYGLYFAYIIKQMECAKTIPENCFCSHGVPTCIIASGVSLDDGKLSTERDNAANHLIAYIQFVLFVDSQINCLLELDSNTRQCVCGDSKQCYPTTTSNLLVQLISLEYPTTETEAMQYTYIDSQVSCLAYLSDRTGKCKCTIGGSEECYEINEVPPPFDVRGTLETCSITECPPDTLLQKKCPTCCPTCIQQYCVTNIDGKKVIKKPNERWSVGACRQCRCLEDEDGFYPLCREKQCNDIQDPDIEYTVTQQEGECCPVLTPVGCKHEGEVFKLGSVISRDECETISCMKHESGVVEKKINRTICDENCPTGFQYTKTPGKCCGSCEQLGCIFKNELKREGSKWFGQGGCPEFTCKQVNGVFAVTTQRTKC